MRNQRVITLVKLAVLAAMSIVLMYFVRFPFPPAPYLEYDMADVPIFMGTFMFGPLAGLALTAVVSVLQWLVVSPQSGWVGALMHFFATGGFVLVAGLIYKSRRLHNIKGALIALLCGAVTMILLMIPLNLIFTVHFNGVPAEAVKAMLLPVIIPFNAMKAGINSAVTFLLYKAVRRVFNWEKRAEPVEKQSTHVDKPVEKP